MKTIKAIFEEIEVLEETVQSELQKIFKSDKQFFRLQKAAKKDADNIPDFFDYVYNVIGEVGIEKMSKKYKLDYDKLAKSFLK